MNQIYDDEVGVVDMSILLERNDEIIKIEQDALALSEIMTDLSFMINEQGENIDLVERTIENAETETLESVVILERANTHVQNTRKIIFNVSTVIVCVGAGSLGFISGPILGVATLVAGVASASSLLLLMN